LEVILAWAVEEEVEEYGNPRKFETKY